MVPHEIHMHRCLQLASLGSSSVAPNPMVGSVLVFEDRIIGEGYHRQYGQAHAEVNCLDSVAAADVPLVEHSTLYVSLEPCAHYGKTPPCADLIISKSIKKVVVGCRDPFVQVNGKGIEKLQQAGIDVTTGVLQQQCIDLNKRFFKFHTAQQPYVVLKWAQSANRIIGSDTNERLLISDAVANRLVHKWRTEEMGIVIGTNTALSDDPQLTARLWPGRSPVRIVVDLNLRLPKHLKVFNRQQRTIIINNHKQHDDGVLGYYQVDKTERLIPQLMKLCYQLNIQSIMVEGGAMLLQAFIDSSLWDEARVIENPALIVNGGVAAPRLVNHQITSAKQLLNDRLTVFAPAIKRRET